MEEWFRISFNCPNSTNDCENFRLHALHCFRPLGAIAHSLEYTGRICRGMYRRFYNQGDFQWLCIMHHLERCYSVHLNKRQLKGWDRWAYVNNASLRFVASWFNFPIAANFPGSSTFASASSAIRPAGTTGSADIAGTATPTSESD